MTNTFDVVLVEHPEESAWGVIGRGLDEFNKQQAGDYGYQRLCFAVQSPEGEIAGGVVAMIYWDWLYVDLMWVREDLRGYGYGSRLLSLVEDEARKRGARHVHLDTFSFQAPEFYRRHGYQVFGELPEYPAGYRRYYLTKDLWPQPYGCGGVPASAGNGSPSGTAARSSHGTKWTSSHT